MKVFSLLWGYSFGGVGSVALTYGRLHEVSTLDVYTVCIQSDTVSVNLEPLKQIHSHVIRIKSRFDLSWINAVNEEIKSYNPDILFVHGFNGPVIGWFISSLFFRRLPLVCSYHGRYHAPTRQRRLMTPLFNYLPLLIYRWKARLVITVDSGSGKELVSKGIPGNKIRVVHNGIREHVSGTAVSRDSIGIGNDDTVLCVASRLDPVKGIGFLIEALKILEEKKFERIRLLIFGDGVLRKELEQKVIDDRLENIVKFMGYMPDVAAWLDISDIFVLPSLSECHPVGLLEAMRAEKAIIASRVGGNPETITDEKEGFLVEAGNVQALADALIRLINDPGLRRDLGIAAGKRFKAEFTEPIMMQNLAACLNSVRIK